MKFFAAILLMLLTVQDKPVQPDPAKAPEQKTEQQEPQKAPVVLPEAETIHVTIAEGKTIVQANGEQKTLSAEEIKQLAALGLPKIVSVKTDIVFENGAFYIKTGSITVPMSGGGASGCLGEASRGKIVFHNEALQQMIETEKPSASEKKQ